MQPWLVWLIVGIAALIGEVFTLSLFLASVAAAAFLAAALSFLLAGTVQIAVFLVLALLFILVVRPLALRVLPVPGSNADPRLMPSERVGVVVERVGRGQGQIRIGAGEFWTARPAEADMVIVPGQEVEIIGTEGLTVLVRPLDAPGALPVAGRGEAGLSPREIEVLRLIALGLSNEEIADRLVVSPRTVHHHVSHILTKLNAENRTEAARRGMEQGLVSLDGGE